MLLHASELPGILCWCPACLWAPPQPLPTLPTSGHCLASSLRVPHHAGCLTTCLKQPSWRSRTTASAACTVPSACRQVVACTCCCASACLHCAMHLQTSGACSTVWVSQRQPSPSNRRWLALREPDSNRSQGSAFCTVLLHRKHCGPPNFANTVLLSCPVHNEATGIMPKENASGKCFALLWLQTI